MDVARAGSHCFPGLAGFSKTIDTKSNHRRMGAMGHHHFHLYPRGHRHGHIWLVCLAKRIRSYGGRLILFHSRGFRFLLTLAKTRSMSIEVQQLTKIYGEQKAVNNISFSLNKGEIVGFLGPNGAGKSTTMKIITGYLRSDGGIAKVAGTDVSADPIAVKRKIGYLPESNPLYYEMYVKEYLAFIAGVHGIENPNAKIRSVIELTGLQVEQKKKLGQLSKGYKQRAGLAAALIHDPEVLILDEPTSGLDPNQIIEIRNVIRQQGKDKTVLFSSHILQEVEAICDRVIIINKGELVADDKLSNLRNKGASSNTVVVSFKEPMEAEWLQRLPATGTINKLNAHTWQITTRNAEQLRKQLLELSLQHNLNIVSLQTEGSSLEDVFRQLTKN
ncbi:MAG: gldA [Chitinophagaceae bacterium]|nr:gldA [Chitinophagaceae bacterium]